MHLQNAMVRAWCLSIFLLSMPLFCKALRPASVMGKAGFGSVSRGMNAHERSPFDTRAVDHEDIVVRLRNITVAVDDQGEAFVTADMFDAGSTSPSGIDRLEFDGDPNPLNCNDPPGFLSENIQVGIVVVDNDGDEGYGTAYITLEDNILPTLVLRDDETFELNDEGLYEVFFEDIDDNSEDNCENFPMVQPSLLTCDHVGDIVLRVGFDLSDGNFLHLDSVTAHVLDPNRPMARATSIIVHLDSNGLGEISAEDVDDGSTAACGLQLEVSPSVFTCDDVGDQMVTLTATASNDMTDEDQVSVTVLEVTAVARNITIEVGASEDPTEIAGVELDGGSFDACGGAIVSFNVFPQDRFFCNDIGANALELEVENSFGTTDTVSCIVMVEDRTPPMVVPKEVSVQLNQSGIAVVDSGVAELMGSDSTDICGIAPENAYQVSPSVFTCADVGPNVVTLTVIDESGNAASASGTVVVEDDLGPEAHAKNVDVQLDEMRAAVIVGADVDDGSTAPCGIAAMDVSPSTFSCADLGDNIVVLTVEDVNGYTSQAQSIVTVHAVHAEAMDITVELDASGGATIVGMDILDTADDSCSTYEFYMDTTFSASPSSFSCMNVGPNIVTLIVTTEYEPETLVATAECTVTVQDNIAPFVSSYNGATIELDSNGTAVLTPEDLDYDGGNDACGIVMRSVAPDSLTCANLGYTAITLTLTDPSGNAGQYSNFVLVEAHPQALSKDIAVYVDESGSVSIGPEDIDDGSYAPCGISITVTPSTFSCNDVGDPPLVILNVTDILSGEWDTADSEVTVNDVYAISKNITVQLDDESADVEINGADIDGGSYAVCGSNIVDMQSEPSYFDCSSLGIRMVTLEVTADSGAVDTATCQVFIEDGTPPIAQPEDINVELDATGMAVLDEDALGQLSGSSMDNCGIATVLANPSAFSCANVGANTVTVSVFDESGNMASATSTVYVKDERSADVVTKDITVSVDASGEVDLVPADVDNGSTAPCGILDMAVSPASFSCNDLGPNFVELSVLDASGIAAAECQVTVEDVPVAMCKEITVELDTGGNASIDPADLDDGSFAACGIAGMELSQSDFSCQHLGSNLVTLSVMSESDTVRTDTCTVTVVDKPVAVARSIAVQLDGQGNVSITGDDIDDGSSTACVEISSLVASPDSFTCSDVGENAVTLTVTNSNGDQSTAACTVTVEDSVAPTAVTQDITVQLDTEGNAEISGSDVDAGSADACGIVDLTASPSSFTCDDGGVNTVVLTVTDANGNMAQETCSVTVEGGPLVLVQDTSVQLDANGTATITPGDVDAGSYIPCGSAARRDVVANLEPGLTVYPSNFTCDDVGPQPVTLTLTDSDGRSDSETCTVTVLDQISPVVKVKSITVDLDGSGSATITGDDIDDGSADACGIASLTALPSMFTCSNVGWQSVNLRADDVNGNSADETVDIFVRDGIAPSLKCVAEQSITVSGTCSYVVPVNGILELEPTDACGVDAVSGVGTLLITCRDIGRELELVVEATDLHGNADSCTSLVTVQEPTRVLSHHRNPQAVVKRRFEWWFLFSRPISGFEQSDISFFGANARVLSVTAAQSRNTRDAEQKNDLFVADIEVLDSCLGSIDIGLYADAVVPFNYAHRTTILIAAPMLECLNKLRSSCY
eukprot:TRINITY_DN5516_c0_g1_i1.p1 TRINITY_DN5516_c0_g1~~TRINITY_DN5516_c0_g1_i1.p1  ORF type:complete len:1652 (-),score=379.96 TRINITY_DN5516_c0_g1_i1:54-5009(-)